MIIFKEVDKVVQKEEVKRFNQEPEALFNGNAASPDKKLLKGDSKKTAVLVGVAAFLVLLVIDLWFTLSMGDLVKYLEDNPVYPYIGIVGIIAVNFIIISVVYLLYKRSSNPTTRFYYINLLITICMVRLFVIINNVRVFLNPPTVEQAIAYSAQVTTSMKTAAVAKFAWIGFLPYFIAVITYLIWKMDHKVEVKV